MSVPSHVADSSLHAPPHGRSHGDHQRRLFLSLTSFPLGAGPPPSFGAPARGHRSVVGTQERIADDITGWWSAGLVDGFTLLPDALPDGLDTFVDHVVPILRKRGVFRHGYTGTTLRDHLGLPVPASSYEPSGQKGATAR
ncbi:hypothetical protein [Streptomyces rapamycinicus]|uniref:Nitrilotriacetate monooxygenase n=1 Tax=Streptomyces rapamycinicus TaxID=1226757 RepID=A0ABR6LBF3_9ACTN|nr:hypothetical protein [Streptomyces rapamycinicus]AGP52211.1 hypothetical protein M271_02900 [Streptomyces rapamycinicus NRRL 5491]MBB4779667.1 hypothetical protein [Streptomyces rapamycinicus]UTP28411.1 hypothetical protein LIV37_03015 [Streptomyces rapamycinicus NRRL 5491]